MKKLIIVLALAIVATACKKDQYNYSKYDCDDTTQENWKNCPCKEQKKYFKEKYGTDITCNEK